MTARTDDDLLKEITERYQYAESYWGDIRAEGKKDMLCVAGKTWEAMDPAGVSQRLKVNRPMLNLDELGQYFNQVINDVRANQRAVQFAPAGNGADDDTAEFYADKMRDIEYRSHAQIAYTTGFENAVQRSYGYCRVNAKRATRRSLNYDLCIEPVHNPDSVLIDPESMMPDGSDMQWAFVTEPWQHEEFLRRFPHAEKRNLASFQATDQTWIKAKTLLLAEYWKIVTRERELIHLQAKTDPTQTDALFADEGKVPKGWAVLKREPVDWPEVKQYLTNGIEILERKDWPGVYIPIACCYGKVIYVDNGGGPQRTILSMTRLARDPQQLYNYYRTCEAEVVGMVPKFPYFVRRGSLNPLNLENLQKSLHEPISVIEVEPNIEGMRGDSPPEFPSRNPFVPEIERMEIGAEGARRAIQAAMGVSPLPTQAQRRNEKSGVALKQIEATQQKGSFHFVDHYDYMIRHVGVIVEDLLPHYYDTARQTSIRKANDKVKMVWINNPQAEKSYSTKGDHIVTISTGPNYESERDRASDFADQLAQNKDIFPLIGPLVVKLKNLGPIGDEIAKALEAVQPPEVRAAMQDGDEQPQMVPIQQVQAQMGRLQQIMGEMQKVIDQKQIEQRTKIQEAEIDKAARIEVAGIQANATIATAEIKAMLEDYKMRLQSIEMLVGHAHETSTQMRQQSHERGMGAMNALTGAREADAGREFDAGESQAGREHEVGMAQLSGQQAMDQAAQQAALNPPTNGSGA